VDSSNSTLEKPQKIRVPYKKNRGIILSGPTATGKTALSLEMCRLIGGEVISADSMQVYREMDIGTAKVSDEERSLVPHHLIDILAIDEFFNVTEFYRLAHKAIEKIFSKNHVPVVVGGSGYYVHTLLYGPPKSPPSVPDVRDYLQCQMRQQGAEVMYERLQILDPEYAKTISEKDRHKIVRALEIMAVSEQKVSDFPKSSVLQDEFIDFRCWFLYYPREILYKRIEERCDEMLKKGLVDEVNRLEAQGLL
jgi:tRNA dimethylallyltransferase